MILNGGELNLDALKPEFAAYIWIRGLEYDLRHKAIITHDSHRYGYIKRIKEENCDNYSHELRS